MRGSRHDLSDPRCEPPSPRFRVLDSKTAECSPSLAPSRNDYHEREYLGNLLDAFLGHGDERGAPFVDVICSPDAFCDGDVAGWIATHSFLSTPAAPLRSLVIAACRSLGELLPPDASPAIAMLTTSHAVAVHCSIRDGQEVAVLRHWASVLGLDHGAPAAAYERFFDRLLDLMSTSSAAEHAAGCCSSAKGLALLWLALRNESRHGQFTIAAASALNVPLRKLEAFMVMLRSSALVQLEFFAWAVRRWLRIVETHLNIFATSALVVEAQRHHAHRSRHATTDTPSSSKYFFVSIFDGRDAPRTPVAEPKSATLFSEVLSSGTLSDSAWGHGSIDLNERHDQSATRVWDLLHAMRQHHARGVAPSSRMILVGIASSDPCVAWMFQHKCSAWSAPMLPKQFTKMAECAAFLLAVSPHTNAFVGVEWRESLARDAVDEDEMSHFSLKHDWYFQRWVPCVANPSQRRHYIDYAQMSLSSKVKLLMVGLGLRFVEASGIPDHLPTMLHETAQGASHELLDAVVDGHTSIVTLLNPLVLASLQSASVASKCVVLAPRIQAAARAYMSGHFIVACKRQRRFLRHILVVQGFVRALASMRHTCHRDVFQRISRLERLDAASFHPRGFDEMKIQSQLAPYSARWEPSENHLGNLQLSAAHDDGEFYSRRTLPQRAPIFRQRIVGLESLEHRARCLVSEDSHREWQAMTAGMILRSPLWGVRYRESIHREATADVEWTHRAQFIALEESALRERLEVIEGRALAKVLAKTLTVRQGAISFAEQRHRSALVEMCAAESNDLVDGFNVTKQLHQLSELRTGASLRQVLDREREYMEAPFQSRELFHTAPLTGGGTRHDSLTSILANTSTSAISTADAIFADALSQSSALTPHYARQRQRFLTSVLENLGSILTAERHERAAVVSQQILAHCRSLESSERSALVRQYQFHLVKYRMLFQRTHLGVLERHHRLPIYQVCAEIRDELHDRCILEYQELRLRLVLKQLLVHQTGLLQKSADDWNAVSADRYRSPGILLAELQQEQRQVQQLLSSLHVAEARQEAKRRDALRSNGGAGRNEVKPLHSTATYHDAVRRNATSLAKSGAATPPAQRTGSQDRRNIRGSIL
jgi:hypothetical protein